jgi:hypothetical protein
MKSKLPDLPRVNKQQEANASLKLREWIESNPRSSCSIEMKDTRGLKYLNYSEIGQEQIDYSLAIQEGKKGVLIRVQGLNGEPDYIYLHNEPALFGIKFPKGICLINVNNLVHEMKTFKKKSLDYSRAKDIAIVSF